MTRNSINTTFEAYVPRPIAFNGALKVNGWVVKAYTITIKRVFAAHRIHDTILAHLPVWLDAAGRSELPVYKLAFLIVHEAREGVWIVLNWWTGGEMMEIRVFFSSFDQPTIVSNVPYTKNVFLCIWELEVIAHERASWIRHVLKNSENPDFEAYANDSLIRG